MLAGLCILLQVCLSMSHDKFVTRKKVDPIFHSAVPCHTHLRDCSCFVSFFPGRLGTLKVAKTLGCDGLLTSKPWNIHFVFI